MRGSDMGGFYTHHHLEKIILTHLFYIDVDPVLTRSFLSQHPMTLILVLFLIHLCTMGTTDTHM